MKGYFGNEVACIFLDQFAASNLFDQPPSEDWVKIRDLLLEKHGKGKLICPVPFEHLLESSNKLQDNALVVDRQFGKLSNGFAFLSESVAATRYMIALVRGEAISQRVFFGLLRHAETLNQEGAFVEYKALHQVLKSQIDDTVGNQNELRETLKQKRFPRSVIEPLYQAAKFLQVRSFLDRLESLIAKGHFISEGVTINGEQVIKWTDLLLQYLLLEHKMTYQESIRLWDLLDKTGFDQIPPLDIRCSLTANIAVEHKKETVNDQIDIMRLSTGLLPSDLVFTDKQRKFELEQTGLAEKYGTKVFSGTKADVKDFFAHLQML
ncbi:MAG: hypothetical protein WC623_15405 [Pedobacter sp.]|uniref:hypothetical protein n=1 Tax=Pedobacter sp. TaxID=1411316 RepID=UPI003564F30F